MRPWRTFGLSVSAIPLTRSSPGLSPIASKQSLETLSTHTKVLLFRVNPSRTIFCWVLNVCIGYGTPQTNRAIQLSSLIWAKPTIGSNGLTWKSFSLRWVSAIIGSALLWTVSPRSPTLSKSTGRSQEGNSLQRTQTRGSSIPLPFRNLLSKAFGYYQPPHHQSRSSRDQGG